MADRADLPDGQFRQTVPHRIGLGIFLPVMQVGEDALKGFRHVETASAHPETEVHRFIPGAVKEGVFDLLGQFFPGHIQHIRLVEMGRQTFQQVVVVDDQPPGTAPPCGDGALADGKVFIRNDFRRIHDQLGPDAVADRTRTVGTVERKVAGLQFGEGNAAFFAAKVLADDLFQPDPVPGTVVRVGNIFRQNDEGAFAAFEGGFHRIVEAGGIDPAADETVHHCFDGVAFGLGEGLEIVFQREDLAIDPGADEAIPFDLFDHIPVLPFFAVDVRCQNHHCRSVRQLHQLFTDRLRTLRLKDLAALGTVGRAGVGVEQTQVVVDFRDRGDRGPGIGSGSALFNGNGRGKSFNVIDFRLAHAVQKLSRVGREAFHIPALTLRIERVKGKRGLAGAGKPGDDRERIPWDRGVDMLQIVLGSAAYNDICHDRSFCFQK